MRRGMSTTWPRLVRTCERARIWSTLHAAADMAVAKRKAVAAWFAVSAESTWAVKRSTAQAAELDVRIR